MKNYVFDSSALIAFFNNEKGAEKVEKILQMKEATKQISIINVFEICYDAAKRSNFESSLEMFEVIKQLPVKIIFEISPKTMENAIFFKTNFKVSVADSIALGLAKEIDAFLITSDHHEFDCIEEAKELDFFWFR